MFIAKPRPLKQQGETIVEVLIAVAVIGMTLGGAFVTTNRNIQASRNTEERSAALKIAESQIEQLKTLATNNPTKIFVDALPGEFCLNAGEVFASTNSRCKVDLKGNAVTATPQYEIRASKSGNNFAVRVNWDQVGRTNQGNVRMVYRLHE